MTLQINEPLQITTNNVDVGAMFTTKTLLITFNLEKSVFNGQQLFFAKKYFFLFALLLCKRLLDVNSYPMILIRQLNQTRKFAHQ